MRDIEKMSKYELFKVKNIKNLEKVSTVIKDISTVLDILDDNIVETPTIIISFNQEFHLKSAKNTLQSILKCCEIGSFSDANMLIRKYRDDLFQFLYFYGAINEYQTLLIESQSVPKELEHAIQIIKAWHSNLISEFNKDEYREILSSENYKKETLKNSIVKKLCSKFFNNTWETINKKSNDYTHSNSMNHLRDNIVYQSQNTSEHNLSSVYDTVRLLSIYFVSIFYILYGFQFRAYDYICFLELGMEPPQNSQYLIPQGIQLFFDKYLNSVDEELKQYLKENGVYKMNIE